MLGASAFLGAVGVNVAVAVFLLMLFSGLRRHFPAVYSPRQHTKNQSHGLPRYEMLIMDLIDSRGEFFLFLLANPSLRFSLPSLSRRCPLRRN